MMHVFWRADDGDEQSIALLVFVKPVAYVQLDGEPMSTTAATPLSAQTLQAHITAHDSFGRRFHALSAPMHVRAHRFDQV
jgi:hypothetical protein